MNIVTEFNDRIDVVAEWLGFGDVEERRDAIRVTRTLRGDRDHLHLAITSVERCLLAAAAFFAIVTITAQVILWHANHVPVGTYYVERPSPVTASDDGDR